MIYEYRAYYVMPGRMPDIQRRFADITMKLFKKHGINVVGFWETMFGESNEMVYICSYDDLAHRDRAWKAFMADPEWLAARKASEANGPLVERVSDELGVHVRLVRSADLRVADGLEPPAQEPRRVLRVGAAEHVQRGGIPFGQQSLSQRAPARVAHDLAQEAIAHLRVAELVALDRARHLSQRRVARVTPVARVEGAVEIHQEVEQGVVRPRFAGKVKRVVRVRHVLEGEVRVEPDGETMEHDRVLELLGEVLGLDQPRLGRRIERLGNVGARGHEAEEGLVARALALVAQHLEQQIAIFRRQGVALVEAVRGCDGALEARQGIARRVDAAPERPSIAGRAYLNGRCAAVALGGACAVRGGRRALVATNAAQQPRRVEISLARDERLGHAGQQAVADVADVGAARGAAQAVVGAIRGGLIHGDAGRRVRPPDVVHGPYLSPGLPPRLQTWKTPPYAPPPAARMGAKDHHRSLAPRL